jgi:NitT/TauT family transport system permease protein
MNQTKKQYKKKLLYSVLGLLILCILWTGASFLTGGFFVPPPWITLIDTIFIFGESANLVQILITLGRVATGFSLAFAGGVIVGITAGGRREIEPIFKPLVFFLQGIPPILWAIPLVIIFGVGHLSPIILIALICFPLIVLNIIEGMKTVPKELKEMLQVFTPGLYPRMRELIFPHLKPFLFASLKLGVVLAIKASVVGEFFGANNGIGFQINAAYQSLQVRSLFAWGMILILLILLFNQILSRLKGARNFAQRVSFRRNLRCSSEGETQKIKQFFLLRKESRGIKIEDLAFSYPRDSNLLEGINLTVEPDEIAVITGHSGIGKTTLLKLIASMLKPSEGRIVRPERLGFAFQDDRLLPWRSIVRNTALPLHYQGYSWMSSLNFSYWILEEVGLSGHELKMPAELSGGMKKRASLSRCFSQIPGGILLDEPFSGLHKEARELLWSKFFYLLKLRPVPAVIVTHFPEEVYSFPVCRYYDLSGKPASLSLRIPVSQP